MELRDYQEKGLSLTRKAFADGHRKILFWLATGGGKSVIFLKIIESLLKSKKPVILVMRRRQLVFQAQKHFVKHGIKSSMIMSNEKGFDPNCDLQICSIDTIARRKDLVFLSRFYAIVVDEAHDCTSPIYKEFFKSLKAEFYFGLTATPFAVGNKVHDFWDCCIKPIEIHELVKQKYLTDCVIYLPGQMDLSGIKTIGGDYNQGQLADKMSELNVIGDVVNSYVKFGNNLPAVCFAVNKEHSIKLCMEFNEQGIKAVHCDESSTQKERDKAIYQLSNGEINVLCNVNIFSTGVDIPQIECLIMARPTKSEILYIQQIGRGLRPYRKCGKCHSGYDNSDKCPICGYDKPSKIKERCVIIDNGNNIDRLFHPFKVRYPALKAEDLKKKKELDELEFKTKNCKICFATYSANKKQCPECGHENEKIQREIKKIDGTMVPYDEYAKIMKRKLDLEVLQLQKGLKENFVFFKLYEDFGMKIYEYPGINAPKWIPQVVAKNMEKEMGKVYQ